MNTSNPTAAVLVIGDEILSGRTHDTNMRHIATTLGLIGVVVKEARTVCDEQRHIVKAVRELSAAYTYVFTTGGIGPTHDDITADAVAAAFGRSIDVRDDARAILKAWYDAKGVELTEPRLRMARIPEGAELIENRVSGAPGFRLENVHVMAGVPRIMQAMLDTIIPTLKQGARIHAVSLHVEGLKEGDVAGPLKKVAQAMPNIAFGSYPGPVDAPVPFVNPVARSTDEAALANAVIALEDMVAEMGLTGGRST